MIKEYLQAIEGIAIYPVIGLILFLSIFLFIIFWMFKIDRNYLKHMKQLPLDTGINDNRGNDMDLQNYEGEKNEI